LRRLVFAAGTVDFAKCRYKPIAYRVAYEPSTRGEIELAHDGRAVGLDRLDAYVQDG
jgi:hypothetical protein